MSSPLPLTEWLGPLFAKEMVEIARRLPYYVSRTIYGVAMLVVLFLAYQDFGFRHHTVSLNTLARLAEFLFQIASAMQFGAVFLFVPLFLCAAIAGEREERTLELLFTTRLTDREIVLGKLASQLAAMACLIFAGVPVLGFITFLGGVDPLAIWRVLAATLLAILFVGAHAIYFSTISRTPLGALVRTYAALAILLGALPGALALLSDALRLTPADPLLWYGVAAIHLSNPIATFAVAGEGFLYRALAAVLGPWFFPLGFVLPTGWSLFLLWRAILRLRREPTPMTAWSKATGLFLRAWQFAPRSSRWRKGAPRLERTWLGRKVENPLWLRARRTHVFDRDGHLARIQLLGWTVALVFLLTSQLNTGLNPNRTGTSMAYLGTAWSGVALLAAVVAGSSLAGDRRRGFLELVLVAPMTGREIIDGTFLAVWEHLQRLYWLPLALAVLFCLTGATVPLGALISIITGTLYCMLVVLTAIACSLSAPTLRAALVATFVLPAVTLAGTPLLIPLFEDAHGPVLWVLAPLFFIGSSVWVYKRVSSASVACFLTAGHVTVAAFCMSWTYVDHEKGLPVLTMHPGAMSFIFLEPRFYLGQPLSGLAQWWTLVPSYWLALVVSIIWTRWWLIRNFDRLAGRVGASSTHAR